MSKRKVNALLQDWGLPISMGGLIQLHHRLAHHLAEQDQGLILRAKASSVLYCNETTGRLVPWWPKGWLWSFTNADFTLYQVEESRTRELVEKVIGKNYAGVLVSICLVIYDGVSTHHLKVISQALALLPQRE